MTTRATVLSGPVRVLAVGVGALLAIYAIGAILFVADAGTKRRPADAERFVVGTVSVEVDMATVTLLGTVPTVDQGRALVESLASRPDVTVVVNRLETDPAAPSPRVDTFHAGLDAIGVSPRDESGTQPPR